MKNKGVFIQAGAWLILVLLLIPALWYSLRTPFGLIDDYCDWFYFPSFSHISGIMAWFHDTWTHPQERFRITFDLYNALTWAMFGGNHTLHHGMRWVLKAMVVFSTYKFLRLMTISQRSVSDLAFWAFSAIYIFYPNNPEARLAPVEILTVTFLALLLYEIGRLCVYGRGELTCLSLGRYVWIIFVFTAMLWSKEPNILLGIVVLMVWAIMNFKRWIYLLPFIVIVLLTALRMGAAEMAGGYGRPALTGTFLLHNFGWICKCLLLCKASWVCPILLGLASLVGTTWLLKQTWKTRSSQIVLWLKTHPDLTCYWLVSLLFLTYFTVVLVFRDSLRYYYPLVYLMALWIGLALLTVEIKTNLGRQVLIGIIMAGSIYLIGANYYNFIYQFAAQYHTRIVEQETLQAVDQLLKNGGNVSLTLDDEYEINVLYYFNHYLPYYKQTGYRIKVGMPFGGDHQEDCYYLTRGIKLSLAEDHWYRQFKNTHASEVLKWSDRVTSLFRFGRRTFSWVDEGEATIGRYGLGTANWYIYKCRDMGSR